MIRSELTAPSRVSSVSAPMKELANLGLINKDTSVFDYGCGHGEDIVWLREKGIVADGWDLHHYQGRIKPADVVTCLYVINVIPTWQEREWVLNYIHSLARECLYIAFAKEGTRLSKTSILKEFNDGILTNYRTFSKLYSHSECLELLRGVFGVEPELVARNTYQVRVSQKIKPINSTLSTTEELTRLYNSNERQRSRLKKKGWLADHVKVEKVVSSDFYRLRSPVADIPTEKGKTVKVLKAENSTSKNYQWIQDLIERTKRIKLIDSRMKYLRKAILNKHSSFIPVKNCSAPLWFFEEIGGQS